MQELLSVFKGWYRFNDAAHQPDHIEDVFRTFETVIKPYVAEHYPVADLNAVQLSLVAHDLFAVFREDHEELAYHFVHGIYCRHFGDDKMLRVPLALAAKEHRASGGGTFSSIYSEIVAAADKPIPTLPDAILRCYRFGRSKQGLSHEEAVLRVPEHLKEKYGVHGYAKYPPLWEALYGVHHRAFQEACDTLTVDDVITTLALLPDDTQSSTSVLNITERDLKQLNDWLESVITGWISMGKRYSYVENQLTDYLTKYIPQEFHAGVINRLAWVLSSIEP